MRVLITGANGQLGYDVVERLKKLNIEHIGVNRENFDLTNEEQTKSFILNYRPDVVIHCAAYTAVDKAEDERDLCYAVNVLGTRYIAQACKELDAKMVYISTDYVFDGEKKEPYEVTDTPNPVNYYGLTKYLGEQEVQKNSDKFFIVRTSWVFGKNGNNFIKTMLKLGQERKEIKVVCDQVGSPTYTYDLAKLLCDMIQTDKYGVYHATNEGYCSWYEFACEIFKIAGMDDVKVVPIKSEEYPIKAVRPKYSRLLKDKLELKGFSRLPNWKDALKRYINVLDLN
ncbi:dTDP-4-dehydrorhamnose reductase [Koleobacter methoxysyntrophicus]|uniref:dTDP-4-dehydrorhamnose reductase n=1 Tax=Koleobacter methoxysyntrophicus TaxID=2751313 RepID=A0A8A0RK84_9FIRM|nr:dTDP-4-dehydrorhamnose reductase [Koleobacter methoxysyntrophicus]QSQ07949.1 dTDP-4-dehydrorhamnose reductase [Koleobacter methoxysyntrophicus]